MLKGTSQSIFVPSDNKRSEKSTKARKTSLRLSQRRNLGAYQPLTPDSPSTVVHTARVISPSRKKSTFKNVKTKPLSPLSTPELQRAAAFEQQFIFKKPVYDQQYRETHYRHRHFDRRRCVTVFQDIKHLFKRKNGTNKPRSLYNGSTDISTSNINNSDNRGNGGNSGNSSNNSLSVTAATNTASSNYLFGNEFNKDIESRYGTWGTLIGKGSGGSVRVIQRSTDNKVFAVKAFRQRMVHEKEREYVKKVTAEFCIGSTLHHDNVIETLDIIQEGSQFYEIMEYAPTDLFSVVMNTSMSRPMIDCCWRQVLNGVAYLQEMGIGHRDLKLDNLVMDDHHIVKIIDFGTAIVARLPFDSEERLTSGICGSDPYIAPEQYAQTKYYSFAADMWSCGIIFVCMKMRRFAWRIPRPHYDQNYQMYLENKNTLLAHLPRYSRKAIASLLEPNPSERSTMAVLLSATWVASISMCTPHQSCSSHHRHHDDDNADLPLSIPSSRS